MSNKPKTKPMNVGTRNGILRKSTGKSRPERIRNNKNYERRDRNLPW